MDALAQLVNLSWTWTTSGEFVYLFVGYFASVSIS